MTQASGFSTWVHADAIYRDDEVARGKQICARQSQSPLLAILNLRSLLDTKWRCNGVGSRICKSGTRGEPKLE